ncbi:MAG: hypothetical protein AAF394_19255, partial [Planctomycetota bacterium]
MNSSLLRHLPAIDEILLQDRIADALKSVPREQVVQWAREEVERLRQQILGPIAVTALRSLAA